MADFSLKINCKEKYRFFFSENDFELGFLHILPVYMDHILYPLLRDEVTFSTAFLSFRISVRVLRLFLELFD